jgi:hypothetical protein
MRGKVVLFCLLFGWGGPIVQAQDGDYFSSESRVYPLVRINSPNEAEVTALAQIERKRLVWNDQRKEMSAVISFSNRQYATAGDSTVHETHQFYLPGLIYEKSTGEYYVKGRKEERIVFARDVKHGPVTSIEAVDHAVVRMTRYRTRISIIAEIYDYKTVDEEERKRVAALETNGNSVSVNLPIDVGRILGGSSSGERGDRSYKDTGLPGTRFGDRR